jgi:hypothetical protein
MTDTEKISEQRLALLTEAMEMLDDMRSRMGMFENQRYGRLHAKVTHHNRLNMRLHLALSGVDTTDV